MITDDQLLAMASSLCTVPGVRAVVLGGSRARGTHHAGSDVDLGLYYDRTALNLDALTALTTTFSSDGEVTVTGPGSWGPWVNGGGWLTVGDTDVDWILRDVDRVREQCHRAVQGQFGFHAQPGHPFGFLDVSYAGEAATCRPLSDPDGVIAELKAVVDPYPPALREAMIANLWQAEFHVEAAGKGLPRQDVAYVMLCCTSALMICAHAWHAAAGRWVTNEKGLVVDVATLPIQTHDFSSRAEQALTLPTADRDNLARVIRTTRALVIETMHDIRGR